MAGEAEGVRQGIASLRAESRFDRLQRPRLERLRHQLLAPDPDGGADALDLDLPAPDGLRHLRPRPPEEHRPLGDADVRPRLEENGPDAFHDIGFEQDFRLAFGHGRAPLYVAS